MDNKHTTELSGRIQRLEPSATLLMSAKVRELKAQGVDVISLSLGETDFFTPDVIKAAAKKAIDDNYSFYSPVAGYPELKKAVCHKFKRDNNLTYEPSQIVVSTGAKNSIYNVMQVLVDAGDEVLIPAPYWVSYVEIVKLAEGTPVVMPTSIKTNYKITPEQLEKAITPRTKAIIYSSPSNPTGAVYTREELKALAAVFARHPHVFIISDEIYEHINFTAEGHTSIAEFPEVYPQTIVVNGLAKAYAMTGWRIGFIGAAQWIAKACENLQGQVTSGTNSVAQIAAVTALMADPKEIVKPMVGTFAARRELVLKGLSEIPGLKTDTPYGAFYAFPDISAYKGKSFGDVKINNSDDLCLYLLSEAHVGLVAGSSFGNDNCIRLSYAASEDTLREALRRIKEALAKLK
ncbi:MAG: pyridoxal phosphate-dependent aminotransferase [Flavobacteriales bacterium]|nr:pyridoxal phosphate-dependent aminotransferase [Flavobacteriales bacterium]